MQRREFMINGSLSALASLMLPALLQRRLFAGSELFDIPRPLDLKLNVKPLFGERIPAELHEGPCRPQDPRNWDPEKERKKVKQEFKEWREELKAELGDRINILEPVYVEFAGDHRIGSQTWSKILSQDREVDFYLLSHYRIPGLAWKTEKPLVFVGHKATDLDVPALLKTKKNEEAYGFYEYEGMKKLLPALEVRKRLSQTRILNVTNGEWDYEYNSIRSNIDDDLLRKKFGMDNVFLPIHQLMGEYEKTKQDKTYLKEAGRITRELVQNAEKNTMKAEDIQNSVLYYLNVKKVMEEMDCNSFTATCQEFCVTKLPMKYKVTPCLTHSLLKDEGYISACESDLNVLFSMALQMYLSHQSAYMGNTKIHDMDKNLLYMNHDVPGLKMKGLDQPDLPYRIVSFTERNWGATLRYDFSRDKGETVTFSRMTPDAKKMLVVKGTIKDVEGLNRWGCRLRAIIKVPDARQYFQKATHTGHHYSLIYGDHVDEMKYLADILGIEFDTLT